MRKWILLFCLLFATGCANPERKGMLKYLHHAEKTQTELADFQAELRAFGRIEIIKRGPAVKEWLVRVNNKRQDFSKLEVPPAARGYHSHLEALFQVLQDYGNETLGNCDVAKLGALSRKWAEEIQAADKELNSLRS